MLSFKCAINTLIKGYLTSYVAVKPPDRANDAIILYQPDFAGTPDAMYIPVFISVTASDKGIQLMQEGLPLNDV